jgi:hypothetical protein
MKVIQPNAKCSRTESTLMVFSVSICHTNGLPNKSFKYKILLPMDSGIPLEGSDNLYLKDRPAKLGIAGPVEPSQQSQF